jgi:hypothetical protein
VVLEVAALVLAGLGARPQHLATEATEDIIITAIPTETMALDLRGHRIRFRYHISTRTRTNEEAAAATSIMLPIYRRNSKTPSLMATMLHITISITDSMKALSELP